MPTLTDQILANSISLNDIVHIARADQVQSDNGSSYKATIAQLIDSEACCLTSGLFTASAGTIYFYGLTNQVEFTVTGVTVFSGGSGSCINNFYTNNIFPCVDDIFVQPNGTNGQSTYFGKNFAASGFTINHIIDSNEIGGPNVGYTKLGLNNVTINAYSTIELFSYDKKTSIRYYDDIAQFSGFFKNFHEYITISNVNTTSNSMFLNSNNEVGILLGSISISDTTSGDYGTTLDGFISTEFSANGINFVSTSDTGDGGYIRFFLGCSPDGCAPDIHINGSGTTKGFMGVGKGNTNPTSWLDIAYQYNTNGHEQLRVRTPYTLTGQKDPNGEIGDFAWDDDYIYIKIANVPAGNNWFRIPLSTF